MREDAHRYGKMEWIFYIIILPLLFTALLSGVILQFLGFDITGKITSAFSSLTGKQTAVQATTAKPKAGDAAKQSQADQDKIKTLEKTKQQLEDDLAKKNTEISELQKQADASQAGTTSNNSGSATDGSNAGTTTPPADPIQDQADIYAAMSASKAAAIIGNLPVTKAKQILAKMTNDEQASILQKMDPVVAGKIISP
ncbi:MAG: magnesium transporter MgtE N-terminal domain-containing protein [Tumebacillaceae bacterium]